MLNFSITHKKIKLIFDLKIFPSFFSVGNIICHNYKQLRVYKAYSVMVGAEAFLGLPLSRFGREGMDGEKRYQND